jgi:hypothetical protein
VLFNLDSPGQLRSWRFESNNVVQVAVSHEGRRRVFGREGGIWKVAEGTAFAEFIPDALDELLFRLGRWDSMRYSVTDEAALLRTGGFAKVSHELEIRLQAPAPVRLLRLQFGGPIAGNRFVLARFDDDPMALRLELPGVLYADLIRFLGLP